MQKKYFFFCIVATTLALPQRGKHDLTPSASTDSQELHSLVDQIFGPDRVKPSPLASSTSSPSDDSGTTPDLEAALDKIFGPAEEKPKKPSPLASSASSCGDDTETKPDLEAQIFNPDDGEKTEAPSQVVPSPPPPFVDSFVGTGEECDLLGRTGVCVKAHQCRKAASLDDNELDVHGGVLIYCEVAEDVCCKELLNKTITTCNQNTSD